ncbi:hypothetical protein [Archangium violaceum]|uniref:Uncharacterized protein n=1 Tax=Archangium violaceum Cb vi76 TaxID=1406225 RepID=A0A084SKT7_9BACT|nr:hypothetical protein [Archangium violaceum]KFA89072.1 hypothetical protein Q664_37200 [Archangium violaceum Cb vi76]
MSFIWFAIKVYLFDVLYTFAIGLTIVPLAMGAVALQPASIPGAESTHRKSPVLDVVIPVLMVALCSTQGLIVAAAVKLSLMAHPDAWWPLWYMVGFGAALPAGLSTKHDDTRTQALQLLCYLGATSGYVITCLWPTVVPESLLRVSLFLAV